MIPDIGIANPSCSDMAMRAVSDAGPWCGI
jgi:hypothetical protein